MKKIAVLTPFRSEYVSWIQNESKKYKKEFEFIHVSNKTPLHGMVFDVIEIISSSIYLHKSVIDECKSRLKVRALENKEIYRQAAIEMFGFKDGEKWIELNSNKLTDSVINKDDAINEIWNMQLDLMCGKKLTK
jgi:hypothetical protein